MKFSFQNHIIDHRQLRPAPPWDPTKSPLVQDLEIKSLPIIQIFGRTTQNESVCVHVHECFPTIYVSTEGLKIEECKVFYREALMYLVKLWSWKLSLDLNNVLQTNEKKKQPQVYACSLKRGRNFYYFCAQNEIFLEIQLMNSRNLKVALDWLVSQGHSVFEAHIPFELQFMINLNIFGMDFIEISSFNPVSNREKISTCMIEGHVRFSDIMCDLERFRNLRDDAMGIFPDTKVMPSIAKMLDELEINNKSELEDRPDAQPLNCLKKYYEKMKLHFEALDFSLIVERNVASLNFPMVFNEKDPLKATFEMEMPSEQQFSQISSSLPVPEAILACSIPSSDSISLDSCSDGDKEEEEEIQSSMKNVYSTALDFEVDLLEMENVPAPECQKFIPQLDGAFDSDDREIDDEIFVKDFLIEPMIGDEHVKESFIYSAFSPTTTDLLKSLRSHGISRKINEKPAKVTKKNLSNLEEFHDSDRLAALGSAEKVTSFKYLFPFKIDSSSCLLTKGCDPQRASHEKLNLSQIEGPTQETKYPSLQIDGISSDIVKILSMEVFAKNRGKLQSNPEIDPLVSIYFSIFEKHKVSSHSFSTHPRQCSKKEYLCDCESDLILKFVALVNREDPDFLLGYNSETWSWCWLEKRTIKLLGVSLSTLISRLKIDHAKTLPPFLHCSENKTSPNKWSSMSQFSVYGRVTFCIWRILKEEFALSHYDFEFVFGELLHRHATLHSPEQLSKWSCRQPERLKKYFQLRTEANLDLLIKTNVLCKLCEFARIFGINIWSVASRGSQFKVESLMLRCAHLEGFLALSATNTMVKDMQAAEALPLVMEPESAMYVDPVIVLDFQSLYPSIMIAYNYCYSTCLGPIMEDFPRPVGFTKIPSPSHHGDSILAMMKANMITISPNRCAFVKPCIRQGILPKYLIELLEGRQAVKGLAKTADKSLKSILDAKQLGLKFIANVTYGYSSASFSGRMPSVHLADSIVQTARTTLERSIRQIEENWNARVVYGDTDSLFILLRGESVEGAYEIGKKMAEFVTSKNPAPVKLKFEKVYSPSVLMTKKRYCGIKYEGPEDPGVYEAKGTETVRRDVPPIVSKLLEKSLKILFKSNDLQEMKTFLQRQWMKILAGAHENLKDFVFANQVKFGHYRNIDSLPPSAHVAQEMVKIDPMNICEYGQRVPYIVIWNPSDRLKDWVIHPHQMLNSVLGNEKNSSNLQINSKYYITKQIIPAINRATLLLGVDVSKWYAELGRPLMSSKGVLDNFFASSHCICCMNVIKKSDDAFLIYKVCGNCLPDASHTLACRIHEIDQSAQKLLLRSKFYCDCRHDEMCWSIHCPTFWDRVVLYNRDFPYLERLREILHKVESE